jgi:hypothetical protein
MWLEPAPILFAQVCINLKKKMEGPTTTITMTVNCLPEVDIIQTDPSCVEYLIPNDEVALQISIPIILLDFFVSSYYFGIS